ncbi:MAG TPA: hypothetical protein VF808_04060 [Ktedonobacterales bacterium]
MARPMPPDPQYDSDSDPLLTPTVRVPRIPRAEGMTPAPAGAPYGQAAPYGPAPRYGAPNGAPYGPPPQAQRAPYAPYESDSRYAAPLRFMSLASHGALKVPEIIALFWVAKLLTTALGESTSDYLVFQPQINNPYVAVAIGFVGLAIAITAQLVVRRYIAGVYWLAALMVAVVGTMAADVLHIVLHVSYLNSTIFFSATLAVVFGAWYAVERTLSIHSISTLRREVFYWAAVMTTFALGTAAGDMTAWTLKLGYFDSILLFAALIGLVAAAYWLLRLNEIAAFWAAYILTRPLGASIADWLGKPRAATGLGWGDGTVSALLFGLVVIVVGYLTFTHKDVQRQERDRQPELTYPRR